MTEEADGAKEMKTGDFLAGEMLRQDLIDLMKKYDVRLVGNADYDGGENFIGNHYSFEGPGFSLDVDELADWKLNL